MPKARTVVVAGIATIILLMFVDALVDPKSHEGILTDQCIRDKAGGNWQGSMGISLEKFCRGSADLQILEQDKKDHPENY